MRPFVEDDLDAYAAIVAEPEVCRYLGNGDTVDRDGAWRQIAVFLGHAQLRGLQPGGAGRAVDGRARRPRGAVAAGGLAGPGGRLGARAVGLGPRLRHGGRAGVARLRVPRARRGGARLARSTATTCRSARVAERIGHRPLEALAFGGQPCVLYGQSREPAPAGPSATLSTP